MPTKAVRDSISRTTHHMRRGAQILRERTRSAIEKQGIGFIVTLLVIFSLGLIFIFVDMDHIYGFVLAYGLLGIFFLSLFTDLFITPFGVDIPLIIMFYVSSPVGDTYAFIAAMLGVIVAVIVSYHIGKKWGTAGMRALVGKKAFEKFTKHTRYGKIYMFISALTPLPYLPYLAGVYKLNWKECFYYLIFPKGLRYGFYLLIVHLFGNAVLGLF